MNIIENIGLQITKKEMVLRKIREDLELFKRNLYIGESEKNEQYFLILVKKTCLDDEKVLKIKHFSKVQNDLFLNLKMIINNDDISYYFAFQYLEISFPKYLAMKLNTISLRSKLILAKQFIEIIGFTNNCNLPITEYDPYMFFVMEKDSNLYLKYFFHGKLIFF